MSLHWYTCITINTYYFGIYYMSLETIWQTFSNISLIIWIHPAIYEILANEAFIVTDDLISQSFIVTFVHPTYVWIALIWGFPVQLSLWKLVYWLWRYKLNEVCDSGAISHCNFLNLVIKERSFCWFDSILILNSI